MNAQLMGSARSGEKGYSRHGLSVSFFVAEHYVVSNGFLAMSRVGLSARQLLEVGSDGNVDGSRSVDATFQQSNVSLTDFSPFKLQAQRTMGGSVLGYDHQPRRVHV